MSITSERPTGVLALPSGAIDVHSHYLPASYRDALRSSGQALPDNIPELPRWDPAAHLGELDQLGIASALLSISSPGILMPTREATVSLARAVNDEGARTVSDQSGRFGLLASLPLPHVHDAVAELRRSYDELQTDGITMVTNYGGKYIGDPDFAPVLAELNNRGAVVLVHPVSPPNHNAVSFGRPTPMLEFPFETTRTIFDLILTGATRRFPDIRWIVAHAGAAISVLADRVSWVSRLLHTQGQDIDVHAELRRLRYDLAGTPLPTLLPALLTVVGVDRLLYGSDLTFTPVSAVRPLAEQLASSDVLAGDAYVAALRGNAETLFPRLAASQPAVSG